MRGSMYVRQYPINEIFCSFQGEASFAGTPAVFIRTQGCPVGCIFCDTKETWDEQAKNEITREKLLEKKGEKTPEFARFTLLELQTVIAEIREGEKHVVITGGEPALFDWTDWKSFPYNRIQMETSGRYPLKVPLTWFVTVSPKIVNGDLSLINTEALERANEIKWPILNNEDVKVFEKAREEGLLYSFGERASFNFPKEVFLHPIFGSKTALKLSIKLAKKYGYRISLQTHKLVGVR